MNKITIASLLSYNEEWYNRRNEKEQQKDCISALNSKDENAYTVSVNPPPPHTHTHTHTNTHTHKGVRGEMRQLSCLSKHRRLIVIIVIINSRISCAKTYYIIIASGYSIISHYPIYHQI